MCGSVFGCEYGGVEGVREVETVAEKGEKIERVYNIM